MMAEREVRERALEFVRESLGRDARYLDSAQTEDGWLVRVVVVERKERAGSLGAKVWYTLHEIFLNADLEPIYHVRRGLWDKGLPSAGSDKEDTDGGEQTDPEPGQEEPTEEAGAGTGPLAAREAPVIDTDGVCGADEAGDEVGADEAGDEVETDEAGDEIEPDEAGDEIEPDEGETRVISVPGEVAGAEGEPSRPVVQEKQGPPRVSLRYRRDQGLREPAPGRPPPPSVEGASGDPEGSSAERTGEENGDEDAEA